MTSRDSSQVDDAVALRHGGLILSFDTLWCGSLLLGGDV